MDFPRLADDDDVRTFLGAVSRAATAEEAAEIWFPPGFEEPVLVYETAVQDGRRIKFRYVASMSCVQVDLYVEGKVVSDCSLSGPTVLIETTARPDLILFSGTEVLNISKDPWGLSTSSSNFYKDTDWSSSEPW